MSPYRLLCTAALALAPPLLTLVLGRSVVRRRADPDLPEHWFRIRHRASAVGGACFTLLCLIAEGPLLWGAPLMILLTLAAGYPARKAVLEERWGLGPYLHHTARSLAAFFGFWLLLALAPFVVRAAGDQALVAAAPLAALLLLWAAAPDRMFLWLTGAQPLEQGELTDRLAAVTARTRLSPPALWRIAPPGGSWANAVALAGVSRSSVAFGQTLLEGLTPEELSAIHAHELAHLEHHGPRALRARAAAVLLALFGVGLVPLARALAPAWDVVILSGFWFLMVSWTVTWALARHKKHEADSDRRAVELCGDADALIRGLTKIHQLARVPRRWAAALEAKASHPSLANRIENIRRAAGQAPEAPAALDAPDEALAHARAPDGREAVVLRQGFVHWFTGLPAAERADPERWAAIATAHTAIRYSHLTELRVEAQASGPVLLAREREGRRRALRLATEDVRAIQAALDRVDGKLSQAGQIAPRGGRIAVQATAVALLLVAGLPGVPAALFILARALHTQDEDVAPGFLWGAEGRAPQALAAQDAVFAGSDRLLLVRGPGPLELSTRSLRDGDATGSSTWRDRRPPCWRAPSGSSPSWRSR